MKNRIIKTLYTTICLLCISFYSSGAELVNASWSASNYTISTASTYTFSYQVVTANPTYAFYAVFPAGFSCVGVSDVAISVDGTPATLSGTTFISGAIVRLALSNTALVTAGSTITVTALVTNASTTGSKFWTLIRTANGSGNAIDQISAPSPVVLLPPAPNAPAAIIASSITTTGFKAYWNTVVNATSYKLDVSTASDFSTFLVGYNDLNVGNTFTHTLTGLTPGATYYYRVRSSNSVGTSASSNVITAVTNKSAASISLTNLSKSYNASPQSASANTSPAGLAVEFTYDGSSTIPTNVGTYAIVGTINDPTYQGTASGTMVISIATASVSLSNLSVVYNASPQNVSVTTSPAGLVVDLMYNGSSTPPTNVGTYTVVATMNDPGYLGATSGTLTISKATAVISLNDRTSVYDGSSQTPSISTNPSGLSISITYNGSSANPVDAGTYAIMATVNDNNYQGALIENFVIAKAIAAISLDDLTVEYDGVSKKVAAGTSPSNLIVDVTYDGLNSEPVTTGTYAVIATINDPNYEGTTSGNLTIAKTTGTLGQLVNEIRVYPNPVSDFVQIETSSLVKNIQLVDLSGTIVATRENYFSGEKIDVRTLNKGVYTVVVESVSGKGYYRIVLN